MNLQLTQFPVRCLGLLDAHPGLREGDTHEKLGLAAWIAAAADSVLVAVRPCAEIAHMAGSRERTACAFLLTRQHDNGACA